jgi:site-specific DNA-methyltransferase (adenine-specific)
MENQGTIKEKYNKKIDINNIKIELYNDHFENSKQYNIPRAQLIIADIPYNIGVNAYASNPSWYKDGNNDNGESNLAGKDFFDTDRDFSVFDLLSFCTRLLKPEPKEKGKASCMIVFCEFEQQFMLIQEAKKHGLNNYINLIFRKNFSAQVLKANMKVVGNCEYAMLLYRDKLPKFNNNGKMIFNCFDWKKDTHSEKIHPCLPAGEKVLFNDKWINIENVRIGDNNKYGKVINTTCHFAEKIIEIKIGKLKTSATWNHPFLVKRNKKIYWMNAEKIKKGDFILTNVSAYYTQKPLNNTGVFRWLKSIKKTKRVILDMQKTQMAGFGLNILLFGKNILGKFLLVCKYIIKILTKQTTIFPIFNLSHPLNIKGCTLVVDLSITNGKNLVRFVENIKSAIKKIGITLAVGLTGKYVKNVLLKNQSKQEKFLLQKVGSVKIINQKTKVYNLTMDNIPAFNTLVGLSHNTQKPVNTLMELINIFTDPGEVVIDPVAGSASTLIAAYELGRPSYGFEIKKDFYKSAIKRIEEYKSQQRFNFE